MATILKLAKNNISLIALYAALLLFLLTTNPSDLHIGWLLVPLVLLYLALYKTFRKLFERRGRIKASRSKVMSLLLAGVPILIMGLGSIGQLTGRDVLIIIVLGAVGLFYVSRLEL
jgi:hypothetical protein